VVFARSCGSVCNKPPTHAQCLECRLRVHSPFTTSNMENAAAMGPAAEQAATADSASATYASDGASGVAATEAAPAPAQATSKPAKAKRVDGGGFHKGCFDYVKSMGPSTPDLVKSVVCCTVMLASGKKVTKFADAQQFCRNKSAALKAVQEFDKAGVDEKLIKEADKLYGGAHDDMEAIAKKSKVVAEMAQWNKSLASENWQLASSREGCRRPEKPAVVQSPPLPIRARPRPRVPLLPPLDCGLPLCAPVPAASRPHRAFAFRLILLRFVRGLSQKKLGARSDDDVWAHLAGRRLDARGECVCVSGSSGTRPSCR